MDTSSDHYTVLGVGRTEDPQGIRHAFRQLITRYHPDRAGEAAGDRYEELVEAWSVLSVQRKRERYDREHPRAPAAVEGVRPDPSRRTALSLFEDFKAPRSALAETFERVLRNFTGVQVPKSEQLRPLDLEVVLTPAQAARGGTMRIAIPTFRQCPVCEGTGSHWLFPCIACDQQGLIEDREEVRLAFPSGLEGGAVYNVPLHGLGIHNLYLRVRLRVAEA